MQMDAKYKAVKQSRCMTRGFYQRAAALHHHARGTPF